MGRERALGADYLKVEERRWGGNPYIPSRLRIEGQGETEPDSSDAAAEGKKNATHCLLAVAGLADTISQKLARVNRLNIQYECRCKTIEWMYPTFSEPLGSFPTASIATSGKGW